MLKFMPLIGIFALVACGGGDDGGGGEPVGVSLAAITSTEAHTVYDGSLAGVDSSGDELRGSFFIANSPPEMLGGVLVTPQDLSLQLSGVGLGPTGSYWYRTIYLDSAGYIVQYSANDNYNGEIVCTPVSPYRYPDRVLPGDSGTFTSMECSIPRIHDLSWRVEDGGDGSILFIVRTEKKQLDFNSSSYRTTSVTDVGYKLDSAGVIIGYSTQILYEGTLMPTYFERVDS